MLLNYMLSKLRKEQHFVKNSLFGINGFQTTCLFPTADEKYIKGVRCTLQSIYTTSRLFLMGWQTDENQ
mgnify:CR=1 FL=1